MQEGYTDPGGSNYKYVFVARPGGRRVRKAGAMANRVDTVGGTVDRVDKSAREERLPPGAVQVFVRSLTLAALDDGERLDGLSPGGAGSQAGADSQGGKKAPSQGNSLPDESFGRLVNAATRGLRYNQIGGGGGKEELRRKSKKTSDNILVKLKDVLGIDGQKNTEDAENSTMIDDLETRSSEVHEVTMLPEMDPQSVGMDLVWSETAALDHKIDDVEEYKSDNQQEMHPLPPVAATDAGFTTDDTDIEAPPEGEEMETVNTETLNIQAAALVAPPHNSLIQHDAAHDPGTDKPMEQAVSETEKADIEGEEAEKRFDVESETAELGPPHLSFLLDPDLPGLSGRAILGPQGLKFGHSGPYSHGPEVLRPYHLGPEALVFVSESEGPYRPLALVAGGRRVHADMEAALQVHY